MWYSGDCGGPRVRFLDDGSIEIEGQGRVSKPIVAAVERWAPNVNKWAKFYNIPAQIVAGVMMLESGGNPRAYGAAKDVGLMQIAWPPSKEGHSDEELMSNPDLNIELGTKILSQHWSRTKGNIIHTLTSYNHGSVACGGSNPWNLNNHSDYVGKVLAYISGAVDSGVFGENPRRKPPAVDVIVEPEPVPTPLPVWFLAGAVGYLVADWFMARPISVAAPSRLARRIR